MIRNIFKAREARHQEQEIDALRRALQTAYVQYKWRHDNGDRRGASAAADVARKLRMDLMKAEGIGCGN